MAPNASVKDAVRTAAVELFARDGFANTSVQQIVDAAGVTKGAMYHYFRSKDDLLFGIYEHLLTIPDCTIPWPSSPEVLAAWVPRTPGPSCARVPGW